MDYRTAKKLARSKNTQERKIEAAVNKAYILAFNGVPVPMLALPAIYKEIRAAVLATLESGKGETLATRLKELLAEYGESR